MKRPIALRCLKLNRGFYDEFALEFSASRRKIAPGIRRALEALRGSRSLLDVGCGDGRVLRAIEGRMKDASSIEGLMEGGPARYRGVDFSQGLLERARKTEAQRESGLSSPVSDSDVKFLSFDLSASDWSRHPELAGGFDAAVCFSVLFHIPGARRRIRLLREIRRCLLPDGRAVISVWQFLHVPRIVSRILPWSEIGIDPVEVDPGDYLVDWRQGGHGMRYVHHFEEGDLLRNCRQAGFTVLDRYRSDGETGDMGLYVLLQRPPG